MQEFFEKLEDQPAWFDPDAVLPGRRAFHEYSDLFIPAFFVVTLQNAATLIAKAFYTTGRVRTEHGLRRIRQNTRHFIEIMLPGAMRRHGDGWKLSVRISPSTRVGCQPHRRRPHLPIRTPHRGNRTARPTCTVPAKPCPSSMDFSRTSAADSTCTGSPIRFEVSMYIAAACTHVCPRSIDGNERRDPRASMRCESFRHVPTQGHRLSRLHRSQEARSMNDFRPQSEREQLIDAIVRAIPLDNLHLPDEFFPAHLPVALIDAIVRSRFRQGESSAPISERYCRHFGIARIRAERLSPLPARGQESLGDLIRRYDELGLDAITSEVFGIRRHRPGQGSTRAANVLRAATVLRSIGIDVLQDMSARPADEVHEALESLPGLGRLSARRVLMYAGSDDFVRGDVHVRRFVARGLRRRSVSPADAEALVREAAYELIVSPRFLDRAIWLHGLSR